MNKKDLKRFKELLEAERDALLKNARKTLEQEATVDPDDLPDEYDLASSEYHQSLALRLRDREKFLLSKIEKAIGKIDDGSFGACEECGEEISLKRLEARPETSLCIKCKEDQEQHERGVSKS